MKDISYGSHARHRIDIYSPEEPGSYPVVIFVHGGAWRDGDKDRYPHLGEWLTRHGIICVMLNYRLTPEVVHPEHTKDVAAAVAWVYKNIGAYGGDKERLYLTGYSAGGHLASLIVLDPSYLATYGLSPAIFKGVATYSGVYSVDWTLWVAGYGAAFAGCDWKKASPINYVRAGLPPWVIIYANNDYTTLEGQATRFHAELQKVGCNARLMMLDSDHELLTENMVNAEAALELIRFFKQTKAAQAAESVSCPGVSTDIPESPASRIPALR